MDIWGSILSSISRRVDRSTLNLLKGIEKAEYKNGQLFISTPDIVYKEWLESNLLEDIKESATDLLGENLEILIVSNDEEQIETEVKQIKQEYNKPYRLTNLNPKFTFSNLIIGNCNKVAYQACIAVAENLGSIYNPLFIYGGVGLGKTHLLHATAHYVLSKKSRGKHHIHHSRHIYVRAYILSEKRQYS
ncbi:MAG: DnaA/Hda family protein [Persephonella sp.]|nr:DnaA/Hda family protein [Persephonella sp.]